VDQIKGAKLTVRMGGESAMRIVFRTEGEGSALQWLEPGQTAAGKLPYVFTQCQAIHARSIFPCQDTPAARIRYRAKVNVPSEMAVVMSAAYVGREGKVSAREEGSDEGMARSRISGDEEEEAAMAERGGMGASLSSAMGACDDRTWQAEGRAVECFRMEQSIPPYLFAMAAGEIVSFDLSPRSRIYAEPPILAAAAHEFSDTESMMLQAEALFGPYEWDRLDLIVMPPSFPYGGMENPRMVFLTPTLIAGDKSGAQVVAHELAHSWTGNLISNATNDDFWLNEASAV
jgi:leukotriene-A4 hydrolase